ncbi:hypothetical protein BKA63DRAFT_584909 [Paraphoma chrysanthemicola]|nr:hypothetical protein BKA63DRAFT_584909 [Paraphoma chrysanthemicola]
MSRYSYTPDTWNPELVYRSKRTREQAPSVLEEYAEANILSLFRSYMPMMNPNNPRLMMPNLDYGPIVEDAVNLKHTCISNVSKDMFDNNKDLLDQVIFGVANPDLCHPALTDFIDNRQLIAVLLVRHFKKFGGLVLPPLQAARNIQDAHVQVVRAKKAAGEDPPFMAYPNWRDARTAAPAPGHNANRGGSSTRGGRGGGNMGSGRGATRGGYGGNW